MQSAATSRMALPTLALTMLILGAPSEAQMQRLQVSDNGRFLQKEDGSAFFWLGDTAWEIWRLNPDEVDLYMQNRAEKGFTVVQGPVILDTRQNYQGQSNGNPSSLNPQWMAHIDLIIDKAEQHGLYIAPVLVWGFDEELFGNSASTAHAYGQTIGQRYADRNHVIAIVAGEFNHSDGPGNPTFWNEMAQGYRDGSQGNHLMSIHPNYQGGPSMQSSSATFHQSDWLDFNMIQSSHSGYGGQGSDNWNFVENDYQNFSPAKPTLDSEANYERWAANDWNAIGVLRRAYWSVFAGGFGHTYGANGVFQFAMDGVPTQWGPPEDWIDAMEYEGAGQLVHLRNLMESRPFLSRIPDQSLLLSSETPGGTATHIHATRDSAGRYAMIFVPDGGRTITVDLNLVGNGNSVEAWWYRAATGEVTGPTPVSPSAGGAIEFTTPSFGENWVLVLDDETMNFGPPGQTNPDGGGDPDGDVNGDGVIDLDDLLAVLLAWGQTDSAADVNGDGVVDGVDLALILDLWT